MASAEVFLQEVTTNNSTSISPPSQCAQPIMYPHGNPSLCVYVRISLWPFPCLPWLWRCPLQSSSPQAVLERTPNPGTDICAISDHVSSCFVLFCGWSLTHAPSVAADHLPFVTNSSASHSHSVCPHSCALLTAGLPKQPPDMGAATSDTFLVSPGASVHPYMQRSRNQLGDD